MNLSSCTGHDVGWIVAQREVKVEVSGPPEALPPGHRWLASRARTGLRHSPRRGATDMAEPMGAIDLTTYLCDHGIHVHLVRRDGGGHLTVFMHRAPGEVSRAAELVERLPGVRGTRQPAFGVLRVIINPTTAQTAPTTPPTTPETP